VTQGPLNTENAFLSAQLEKVNQVDLPKCYFPGTEKKTDNPTFKAKQEAIPYSAHKLVMVANLIAGKHVYDAKALLDGINKKGGEIVRNLVGNALRSGVRDGYAEERMFVKTITVGKSYSHKKIDIKGRGRHGMIHVPRCNIHIVMEERSLVDFYKMMLKGDSTPGLGMFFRKMLY